MPRWWTALRDVLLFVFGLAGVAHETLLHTGPDRWGLLALFGAMLGLPYALGRARDEPPRPGTGGGTGAPTPARLTPDGETPS